MRQICVGDLVERRRDGKIGVVVDARPPNQGLNSLHVQHMLSSYHDVYYVLFSEEGKQGPFHFTELRLEQSCETNANVN